MRCVHHAPVPVEEEEKGGGCVLTHARARASAHRINSRALMRFGVLYFLVDAVWGIFGLVLTGNALGNECVRAAACARPRPAQRRSRACVGVQATNVPRLTTLMSLLSLAFGVGGVLLSCTVRGLRALRARAHSRPTMPTLTHAHAHTQFAFTWMRSNTTLISPKQA